MFNLPLFPSHDPHGVRRSRSAGRPWRRPPAFAAPRVTESVCPYCAVGCGLHIYTKGGKSSTSRATPTARSTRARSAPRAPTPSSSPSTRIASSTCCTGRPTPTTGKTSRSTGRWTASPQTRQGRRATRTSRATDEQGRLLNSVTQHGHARRRDAGQRRKLPDQEAVRRRASASSPSKTRPGYDTAPRCPVWAPRSAAARPPPISRTWPTATAS